MSTAPTIYRKHNFSKFRFDLAEVVHANVCACFYVDISEGLNDNYQWTMKHLHTHTQMQTHMVLTNDAKASKSAPWCLENGR